MNIVKFLDKDVLDYWEVKDVSTLSDKFELNGDVYFEKGQVDDGGYDFYLGPSIDNGVSDSISMNRYIDKICKELSININVGVAENAHTLVDVTSDKVADKIFRQILLRIKSDELNIDMEYEFQYIIQ
jgi:hypothetical protein